MIACLAADEQVSKLLGAKARYYDVSQMQNSVTVITNSVTESDLIINRY